MALMSLRDVSVAFGGPQLLDGVTLHVEADERICLLGRNGAGKSTLLKVLAGALGPDQGKLEVRQGLRVAMLEQEVPAGREVKLAELVQRGLAVEDRETAEGARRVEEILSRFELEGTTSFAPLSAGNKRRVLLARALVGQPDILLLDEPTNHLDIPSVEWMEQLLRRFEGTVVFVSHDRAFVRKLATRVVELDRGQLMSFPGSYATFEARKAGALEAEEKAFAEQDKKLAQEEAWIRRGIKARGVRNMGRVRALEKLRAERRRRRERQGKAKVVIQEADRSGTLVLRAEQLAVGYGDGPDVVTDFSTIILRGDRVGIVGPNGCGKTTLLRTLLGEIAPRRGQCRQGSNLEVAYFDQLRGQLDGDTTVADSVSGGPDWVMQGERRRHVIGYLEDFLFTPDRARSPVKALSGGERNRLLLAKLFLKPSNVMVLDEPTNDLDVETLELLEERLGTYGGTVLVVSHDREFVDNVVTSTIAYVEGGVFTEHAGGYSDWLEQERAADKRTVETARPSETRPASEATVSAGAKKGRPRTEKPRKLSFKEKRELESLPQTIEALEAEQSTLHAKMADPGFYKGGPEEVATATARLASIETELARAYERWEALEAIAQGE